MSKNTYKSSVKETSFEESMHFYGRLGTAIAFLLMLCLPLFISVYFKATPNVRGMLVGMASICLIYLPSSIIEVITYAPILGTGATYLAFVTGNLINLKIPCCMNAREAVGAKFGSEESEIISTLSVAVSSLVTCAVLAVGVALLAPLTPLLSSPVLQPAFNSVVPALFGALGYQYFSKAPIIAVTPFVAMAVLCLLVPAAANQVAVLVPVSAVISMLFARLLYKKGKV